MCFHFDTRSHATMASEWGIHVSAAITGMALHSHCAARCMASSAICIAHVRILDQPMAASCAAHPLRVGEKKGASLTGSALLHDLAFSRS